jgi:hypothetical protein
VLDVSQFMRGAAQLATPDFAAAFILVSLGGLVSILLFMRLPHNAGASLSGHKVDDEITIK